MVEWKQSMQQLSTANSTLKMTHPTFQMARRLYHRCTFKSVVAPEVYQREIRMCFSVCRLLHPVKHLTVRHFYPEAPHLADTTARQRAYRDEETRPGKRMTGDSLRSGHCFASHTRLIDLINA
jgi:hypothetical protein